MKRILTIFTAAFLAVTLCLGASACTFGRRDPAEIGDTENEETLPPVDPAELPGMAAGRTYINRFFGLRLDLDDKWEMKTEAELKKLNEDAIGVIPDGYADVAAETDYFCDMAASSNNGFRNVSVVIQNLHGTASNVSEKTIVDQTAAVIRESYGSAGYTDIVCTTGKASVCGVEHDAVMIEARRNGVAYFQKSVVCMKNGCYASISVSSYVDDCTGEILALFGNAE